VKPSQHLLTAIDIAARFTGQRIKLERQPGGEHLLAVG
jgi:RNA 3'-terminal phosphate cyclase (ATP)